MVDNHASPSGSALRSQVDNYLPYFPGYCALTITSSAIGACVHLRWDTLSLKFGKMSE